jgi:translation initiation factor RLI1
LVIIDDKLKSKNEITPARRWSFLVGKNEGSHTAQERFVNILKSEENPNLAEIEQSFNIETVTKEFFDKYTELFFNLKEELDELVKNDSKIAKDFKDKDISTVDFAKKTLGQIVFLYFLQKKGWFGVAENKE